MCDVALGAGFTIDSDALCAALGLSLMVPAVPDEPALGEWTSYARDAFLIPAGRLFGLTIRAMHPPEAARGLTAAGEFRQHFDASYRPLVLRALEHSQPVLAWQGWPGEARLAWGLITDACDEGVGLVGRAYGCGAASTKQVLKRPPVQLYVVETIERREPEAGELLEAFLAHGRIVLTNALCTRFGVTTGPDAYDQWIERLRAADAGDPAVVRPPLALAASAIAGHQSAKRFITSIVPLAEGHDRSRLDSMSRLLSAIVASLTAAHGSDTGSLALELLTDGLPRARNATAELAALLMAK